MERHDGHGADIKLSGRRDSCQEVWQSPGMFEKC